MAPNTAASSDQHSQATTAAQTHDEAHEQQEHHLDAHDVEKELERQRHIIEQAAAEGHDADIPSDIGYVLDDKGEARRWKSIADQRELHLIRTRSRHSQSRDVEKGPGEGGEGSDDKTVGEVGEEETDPNVVWWDGPDDPQNPYNWPTWRKSLNVGLISALTLLTPLASSMLAPGVPQIMKEFGNDSPELAAFVVSVYILGFAFGPLLMAPLSEIYGRTIIYHGCNLGFVAFLIGCAKAPSLDSLIVFRFFCGVFGACPLANGGGTIADMVEPQQRAGAMALFTIGPLLGPIIGPIAGGFLSSAKGWRWIFWLIAIVGGFLAAVMLVFLPETYAPVILQRKVDRLRRETGNDLLRSKLDIGLSPRDYFSRGIVRPLKLLFLSPIVMAMSLYIAVVYGYLYIMFTSITTVFEQYYGFSSNIVGLVFLGLGVGNMIGLTYFTATSDRYIKKKAAQEGRGFKPEYRLKPLPIGAVLFPIGFFIYGWTAQYHVHWIVPILSHVIIGAANLIIFMALQMYLVDAFNIYAASALAASTVVRSIFGAVLPLAGLRMYAKLGMGWGNSTLGFIAFAMVPLGPLFLKYGERLRTKFEMKDL